MYSVLMAVSYEVCCIRCVGSGNLSRDKLVYDADFKRKVRETYDLWSTSCLRVSAF